MVPDPSQDNGYPEDFGQFPLAVGPMNVYVAQVHELRR